VHWVALGLGAALLVAALVGVGRRGVPGWLRGAALFAFVFLIVLGAWLPTVVGASGFDSGSDVAAARFARGLLPWIVGVPLVAAAVATGWVMRARWSGPAPREVRVLGSSELRILGWSTLGIGYVIAIAAAPRDYPRQLVLSNLAHVLAGAVALAWCALLALAIGHLRAVRAVRHDLRRPRPWVQDGVVYVDGPPGSKHPAIARLQFLGWLGGFAASATGFRLRTRGADLPVPAGARVVTHLGPWSVSAAPGDSLAVVEAGDQVVVSGFVAPVTGGPFREASAPVAGSSGLVISLDGEARPRAGTEVVLALWRPCLLFLLASVLAALPVALGS
jgi:hypothetical protein